MTITLHNAFIAWAREGLTQLALKYRMRVQQGIKSDEMVNDLFIYNSGLRIVEDYDTADIPLGEATYNIITPLELQDVKSALSCILTKYNVKLDLNYYLGVEEGGPPADALFMENGDPILTESGEYLTIE